MTLYDLEGISGTTGLRFEGRSGGSLLGARMQTGLRRRSMSRRYEETQGTFRTSTNVE